MNLRGTSVFVTGAGGFAGGWLARTLVERGARVHGYGLGAAPEPAPAPMAWHTGDVLDAPALRGAIRAAGPAAIVHLAAQPSAAASFAAPLDTFRANVLGTRRVLEAVRDTVPQARVLVVASSEIYGATPVGVRTSEEAALQPVSPYGLSKAVADRLAEAFGAAHGLDVVRARAFGHTGPGQAPRFVIAAWAAQVARIERGEAEPILRVGNLDVTRDLTDVRDVVEAYARLLERGRGGIAYNICRGEGARLVDVARALVAQARCEIRVEVDPALLRPADVPYLVGDPGRLEAGTGWQPRIPFEQMLQGVLADWRQRIVAGA